MMRRFAHPIFAVALVAMITAAPLRMARADEPQKGDALEAPSDAEGWYQKARAAHKAGQLDEAERCYRQAWALQQSFDIAGNLGAALLDLGKMRDAAEFLAFAVREVPPSWGAEKRRDLEQLLAKAKQHVGTLTVSVTVAGATVSVDRGDVGVAPLKSPVFVEPGPHHVGARMAGYEASGKDVSAQAGAELAVTLSLTPMNAGDAVSWPVVGTGFALGGAATVVSIALGAVSARKLGDVNDIASYLDTAGKRCPTGSSDPTCADLRAAAGDRDTFRSAALGVGISGALLLAGTAIYLGVSAAGTRPSQAYVTPWFGPSSVGVSGAF